MPGNLTFAVIAPTDPVLPQSLSTAFTESLVYPLLSCDYHDGTVHRSLIEDGGNPPRALRSWQLSKRLTTAQLSDLLAFWELVGGGRDPFWFYHPLEADLDAFPPTYRGLRAGTNYDPLAANVRGRIPVVFRGNWQQSTELGRHVIPGLMLVEVMVEN